MIQPKVIALSMLVCFQTSIAQVPPPLRTVLEVEYVGSNYALGTGMIGLGDINSDGKPDFAVSAGNIGRTLIYFGGQGVLDDVPDLMIKGGREIAKGDLNGDGKMDLVIAGRETLYVYYGKDPSPIAIDTIPGLIIPREPSGGAEPGFGRSFAVGDLNGDGFDDLVVGAPNYDSRGKVYVYFGESALDAVPDFTEVADSLCSSYGITVRIGDINADGYGDLCVGSIVYVNCSGLSVDARLDVFYGKSDWDFNRNAYDQRLNKTNTGFEYMYWFSLVDVNADGKTDISYTQDNAAYFFFGRADSVRHVPDLIFPNPDTNFYLSFAGPGFDIGDINKDGRSDFALRLNLGGSMCLAVYLGSSAPDSVPVGGRCKGGVNQGYHIVTPVGDVNGDGVNDFGAVAPANIFEPKDGYFVIFSGDTNYVVSVEDQPSTPQTFSLSQNYPNPFNPSTTIEYMLDKRSRVVLLIYDSLGKEITKLVDEEQAVGVHTVDWNGQTSTGRVVATGVYYYSLVLDGIPQATKKSLLLK